MAVGTPSVEALKSLLDPWLRNNPVLLAKWEEGVGLVGYTDALEWVQQSPEYDVVFPGNKREDGSIRYSEDEYLAVIESYQDTLISVGLEPSTFSELFPGLIEGNVSGDEFRVERVEPMYDLIIERGQAAIDRYAQDWNLDMTVEAILAAALDPQGIGSKILNRQISISSLRYESDRLLGSETTNQYLDLAVDMYEAGTTQPEAVRMYEKARTALPVLSALARRHADPDDTFDLDEFAIATLYNDPEESRRMRRLVAQESSLFTGGSAVDFAKSRAGGVAGLAET